MKRSEIKHLNGFNRQDLVLLRFQTLLETLEERIEELNDKMDTMLISDSNKLYSPKEVAQILSTNTSRVHRNTVLTWIKHGRLAYLEGTTYKIPGSAIKAFIAQNTRYREGG